MTTEAESPRQREIKGVTRMAVKAEEGPRARDRQRLLGAERGKETDSLLEPPVGAPPRQQLLL